MEDDSFDRKKSYGLAVLSGILLLLSFPPFNFGSFLAWFALVPLLIAVYNETNIKRIGRLVLVTGLCIAPLFVFMYSEFDFFLPSIVAWPLGIIVAVAIGEFVIWYVKDYWKPRQLQREKLSYLPHTLQIFIIPVVGTAVEFLAMNLPVVMKIGGGLGFFSLSRTQWLNTPILQSASFTGMYGVTFLILLLNSAIAYLLFHYKETKSISKQAIAVLLVFGIISIGGWISIPEYTDGDTTVAIIQAKPQTMETEHINELYRNLSEYSLKYNPDIILWPIWVNYEVSGQSYGPFANQYTDFSEEHNIYLVSAGGVVYPDGKIEQYNHSYLFVNVFDGVTPFDLNKILPEVHGFDTKFGKLGILLCMESASTIPAKKLVEDGTQFIVVTSGNAPVIGTLQGLLGGNVVYRAVEHRIYTAFFFGHGGSIIVDPYGRIIEDMAPEQDIVAGKFSISNETTFYSKYGNVFGWTIVGLAIVLVGYNFYLKRKSPFKYCQNCSTKLPKDAKFCSQCGKNPDEKEKGKAGKIHKYGEMALFVIIAIIIILFLTGVL